MTPSREVDELIHEMRNELAVASANLEALVDGKLDPTRERLLAIIQALSQLDALIEDLRVLSPDVQMQARPSYINVCELLNREYEAIDAVARAKNITVSIDRCPVPAAGCTHFYGDPTRIGQIAKNILLNAVRYTPKGGSISIECSRRAGQLEVRISDGGPGIKEEEAPHVFQSGFRGSAAEGAAGSGYGLAVVKQLVEAHGGSVSSSAATPQGATFTVRLPGTPKDGDLCTNCRVTKS